MNIIEGSTTAGRTAGLARTAGTARTAGAVLIGCLALLAGLALPHRATAQAKGTDPDKIAIPLTDPSRPAVVKASLLNGSITVKAYQGKEVIVSTNRRPGDESMDEEEDRDEITDKQLARRKGMKKISNNGGGLTVEEDNNEVEISTGWRMMGSTIDMVVQVPVNSSVSLNTMNDGDITVTGVKGDVEASNLNGNIVVKDVDGSVVADAMNGDIDVVFAGIDQKKSNSFSSMNGEIDVTIPASGRATVKLKTDQGDIFSDFDMKLDVATEDYRGEKDHRSGKHRITVEKVMTGDINGGGAGMTFNNFNGNIYIRKGK